MSKKNLIVGPQGHGKWTVKEAGKPTPLSTHRTQGAAIEKAERLARQNETELIVRGRDARPVRGSRRYS